MSWRESPESYRQRLLQTYDQAGVEQYESWTSQLSATDDQACLADLEPEFRFEDGMRVLDAGAGTGAMCRILLSAAELELTALEPCPAMIDVLGAKRELNGVRVVQGFCDAPSDRKHFAESSFDVVVSRQLGNGLYDPVAAFKNWLYWLRPGGTVLVIDGIYDRDAWSDTMDVDTLPLGACRTLATAPYLLHLAGFEVTTSRWMVAVNQLASTRTPRYIVIGTKPTSTQRNRPGPTT